MNDQRVVDNDENLYPDALENSTPRQPLNFFFNDKIYNKNIFHFLLENCENKENSLFSQFDSIFLIILCQN